jgi:aminopeptidase-like protein
MMKILEDLTPLNRVMCSSDYDRTIEYLLGVLPLNVLEYPSTVEHNGWVIPPKWDIKEAKILKNGKVIYDGTGHVLAVIALSKSFRGKVDLLELKKHLHYDHRYEDAIPFHFRQQFRNWDRDWGFCVPRSFCDRLEPGDYEVIIETEESDGVLKILEYTHTGDLDETIAFGGNLDHPGVANDGLAGCVVGIEVLRRLKDKRTKFTYKLALVQGIIGSELYLGKMEKTERDKIREGVFLEMLGSETQLALQASRNGGSNIEYGIEKALDEMGTSYRRGPFESIIINDEYIWENYGIPMTSLSRFPYPEYHSDKDNLSIISEKSLNEAVEVLIKAIELLESSSLVFKKFEGNVCLSNPKYDLYIDPGQIDFGDVLSEETKRMRFLMDLIPALHRPTTVKAIADRVELPEDKVYVYLKKWADRGLLDLK